jgi:hypothetical protein
MRVALVSLALLTLACTGSIFERDPVGHPRIEITVRGGYEGARWSMAVDAEGNVSKSSEGDDGGGTIHWSRCHGKVDASEVAPWFEAMRAARLSEVDQSFRDAPSRADSIVNESMRISLAEARDDPRFPADIAEFVRLRELATTWQQSGSTWATDCTNGTK